MATATVLPLDGPNAVPSPPIYNRLDLKPCYHVAVSPKSHVEFQCQRLAGHTGRHAAYGWLNVAAVWEDDPKPPTATIPIYGEITGVTGYDLGAVTVTLPNRMTVTLPTSLAEVTR